MTRPLPATNDSRRTMVVVLAVGGLVVLALVAAGSIVRLRQPAAPAASAAAPIGSAAPVFSAAPPRLEPSTLLAEARHQATAWHREAVLISLSASPLDAHGVAPGGKVEITYGRPSGPRIVGGAQAAGARLVLSSSGGSLQQSEEHATKSRVALEPNCLFEDAWTAAQRAGADANAGLGMRYLWSDKLARPVWEVLSSDGSVQRRLDGVSCSILVR